MDSKLISINVHVTFQAAAGNNPCVDRIYEDMVHVLLIQILFQKFFKV